MPEISLSAKPALSEAALTLANTTLRPVDVEMASIALSEDGTGAGTEPHRDTQADNSTSLPRQMLGTRLHQHQGLRLPGIGKSDNAEAGLTLYGLQANQWLLTRDRTTSSTALFTELQTTLAGCAWLTDQSDAWAAVELHGKLATLALERCCMLDLAQAVFDSGEVRRTRMEHLGVILHRQSSEEFRLFSPRSSAADFWHMLVTSLHNVV